jgi:hypothetical protein
MTTVRNAKPRHVLTAPGFYLPVSPARLKGLVIVRLKKKTASLSSEEPERT